MQATLIMNDTPGGVVIPTLYKVILVDNLDRETVSDRLLKENLSKEDAEKECSNYNMLHDDWSDWFARIVPQCYELYDASKLYL